jgi:glycosyltransferase involved in cell wall biosynthesis
MNPWLPRLRLLSRLATTIVVSDLSRKLYLKMGWDPTRTLAISNGIDVGQFKGASPKTYPLQPNTFRVGCIARLTHDKGVDLLIEAVRDLPNIHLTIVGTGREEENLRALLKKNLPTTNYQLLTTHPHPADFYHSLDTLVLPSRSHDPFGLVVAEAMAAGVPTIATDACGIVGYLTKAESIVVPAGSSSALRGALGEVQKKNIWENLAKRGPEVAKEKFSLSKMVDAYAALLS